MPKTVSKKVKIQIKRSYLAGDDIGAIADWYGLNSRTIHRWAKDEDWRADAIEQRMALTPDQSKSEEIALGEALPDSLSIIEDSIATLRSQLNSGLVGRDAAMVSNSLSRLIAQREELSVWDVPGLVDFVVAKLEQWDLGPRDFIIELRDRHQARK